MPVIAMRSREPWNRGTVLIISGVKRLFAWTGALLFLLSLLSFGLVYGWRLRVAAPGDLQASWPDVLANIVLFTIFALHHSIMARMGAKAWIARLVPPDLERSLYVWIASLLFLAVCWLWQPLPGVVWEVRGVTGWILVAIQLGGVVLTLRAARLVGVWDLAGITQPDHTKPVEFRADGPFGIVRHPIYLGWVLMVFGAPVMTTGRLVFAVVSTAYLVVAIPLEEASLVAAFGERYRAYQRVMKWRLIPGLW
jgi:protein-S-isoprenylcysteine O-methyltransferase Ste14